MRPIFIALILVLLAGCSTGFRLSENESQKFNAFLDKTFDEFANHNPEFLTNLGKKVRYSELSDYSEAFEIKMRDLQQAKLEELKKFDFNRLDAQSQLSYKLFKKSAEESIADFQWKDYGYPINQMYGIHTNIPSFLMNMHRVDNETDIHAYVARLHEVQRVFKQVLVALERAEKKGVVPPKFVFPYAIDASQNIIKGKPFDNSSADSPLFADFKAKLAALKLDKSKNDQFAKQASEALLTSVKPSYTNLIAFLKSQEKRAKKDAGVWKLPRGNEYYKTMVARHTTTDMTPEQIHELGVKNIARLQADMRAIMTKLNYKGSLQQFFNYIRTDKKFYFPNTDDGRKAYLDLSKKYYEEMSLKIPQYFQLLPQAGFEIRAVEKFRENSAGIAFYENPSEDGKRPGVYYVNLRDMMLLPKHEAEVVLYHEGAPGHHFQIALAQELKGLPKVRKYAGYTAFSEGWGLYTERLAKEMGGYKDLYSEFGKLSLESLRAARLVVDTGIHSKKWTREKAIKYFRDNIPGALDDQKSEIERYIVMPGQATAYMVGMLKIYELREKAKVRLGNKFDIRKFHDIVLGNGALPLSELEILVDQM